MIAGRAYLRRLLDKRWGVPPRPEPGAPIFTKRLAPGFPPATKRLTF